MARTAKASLKQRKIAAAPAVISRKSEPRFAKHYIAEWREYRELTQQELADRIKRTSATVSRVESNLIGYSQVFLERCAKALECQPGDLVNGPPDKAQQIKSALSKLKGRHLEKALRIIDLLTQDDAPDIDAISHHKERTDVHQ